MSLLETKLGVSVLETKLGVPVLETKLGVSLLETKLGVSLLETKLGVSLLETKLGVTPRNKIGCVAPINPSPHLPIAWPLKEFKFESLVFYHIVSLPSTHNNVRSAI